MFLRQWKKSRRGHWLWVKVGTMDLPNATFSCHFMLYLCFLIDTIMVCGVGLKALDWFASMQYKKLYELVINYRWRCSKLVQSGLRLFISRSCLRLFCILYCPCYFIYTSCATHILKKDYTGLYAPAIHITTYGYSDILYHCWMTANTSQQAHCFLCVYTPLCQSSFWNGDCGGLW